jgi:hypothetical protein
MQIQRFIGRPKGLRADLARGLGCPEAKIAIFGSLFFFFIAFAKSGLTILLEPTITLPQIASYQIEGLMKIPCHLHGLKAYGFEMSAHPEGMKVSVSGVICRDVVQGKWDWDFPDKSFARLNPPDPNFVRLNAALGSSVLP